MSEIVESTENDDDDPAGETEAGDVDAEPAGETEAGDVEAEPVSGALSSTERGWDGWPTPPTPDNLIPKIGEIPVSSTVHYQTVAMTSLGDETSSPQIWAKIRAPLLDALRRNAVTSLKIVDGNYGDSVRYPRTDLTTSVESAIVDNTLSLSLSSPMFFDRAGDREKHLRLTYSRGSHVEVVRLAQHESLALTGRLTIERAQFGDLPSGAAIDVTELLSSMIDGDRISVAASNGNFAAENNNFEDPAPGIFKSLVVEYIIDGAPATVTVPEDDMLDLGGKLSVLEAIWGVLPTGEFSGIGRIDVTDLIVPLIEDGRLVVVVNETNLGNPGVPPEDRSLYVMYLEDGVERFVEVAENEKLDIGRRFPTEPTQVYDTFFQPPVNSVADLAKRLTDGGVKATDINPESVDLTMEDELNLLIGIAPQERLDPLAFAESDSMDTPAEGVILYHEQGWYVRGLALGNLLHSVALAPGEVTQIAMTNWSHSTSGSDSEDVSQTDSAEASDHQNRAVTEVQDASLREHTFGDSSGTSDSSSSARGTSSTELHAGVGWGSVHAGASGSTSSRGSSSTVTSAVTHSSGSKDLSMASNQKVNAATQRHAEASRTRRAAVVREVSQGENENLTTRVLANYNHMHALSMMYFEVVELFSLQTRVVDADRVIFLPFVVRDVVELIPKYRATLVAAASGVGKSVLADAIAYAVFHVDGDGRAVFDYTEIEAEIIRVDAYVTEVGKQLTKLDSDLADVPKNSATARADLVSKQKELGVEQAAIADKIRTEGELGAVFARFTIEHLQHRLRPVERNLERVHRALEALDATDRNALAQLERRRVVLQRRSDDARSRSRHLAHVKTTLASAGASAGTEPFEQYRLFLNQSVWLSLSPGEVLGLARRRHTFRNQPIFEQIDPSPIAVSGNYVGYRWRFDDESAAQQFKQRFVAPVDGDPNQHLAIVKKDIAVPTGGVFGEAVLGQAVSAEKIDLSRFWNWKDSPIPILPTSINPLTAATPAVQDMSTLPGQLDASSAKLDALRQLPEPSSFGALAQTMQAQTFRDMSGQDMLKSLAEATTTAASNSEMEASEIASQNLKAGLDFVSRMAALAASAATAPETGGANLLGGLVDAEESGGSSVLGGVLNAKESDGKRDLLSRLTGDTAGGRHIPEFPKVPDHEPGVPEFPKVPDHEPGVPEFPKVPDHEP